jgi:hypothetical protein
MDDLKHFWIIARDAGVCIFEASLGALKKEIDGDLIAGFFTAMLQFAQEVSDSEVKSIKLGEGDLLFSLSEYVLCVLWVDEITILNRGAKTLRDLEAEFNTKYQSVFEANWGGNVDVFEDFAVDVERITNQKPMDKIASKFLGKPFRTAEIWHRLVERRDLVREFIANQSSQMRNLLEKTKIFQKIAVKRPKPPQ